MKRTPTYFTAFRLVLLSLLVFSIGCGRSDDPRAFQLSGQATFDGEPIPWGSILLEPDSAQGNTGPAGVAEISQGRFRTRSGSGHVGGPHVVTIIATDGSRPESPDVDNSLFPPYQTKLDLPAENSEHDFEVPRLPVR